MQVWYVIRAVVVFFSVLLVSLSSDAFVLKTTYQLAPPKYMLSRNGTAAGLCVDIINELNRRLAAYGIKIVSDGKFRTAGEIYRLLSEGKIDLFVGFAKTPKRLKALVFSKYPLYSLHHAFLIRASNRFFRGVLFSNGEVAVPSGTRSLEFFKRNYVFSPFVVDNVEDAVRLLKEGKVYAVFYSSLSLAYYRSLLGNRFTVISSGADRYYHYIAYRKGISRKTKSILDKVLFSMLEDGTLSRIISSNPNYSGVRAANELVLANIDWPPYEFFENGTWRGIDVEVVKKVFSSIGFKVKIKYLPWARILEYLRRGVIDGTFTISRTPKRERYLWYSSEPLTTGLYGFLYIRGRVDPTKIGSAKLRCAYIRGFSYEPRLRRIKNLRLFPVPNDWVGIKALIDGRVDLFVANKFVGLFYLKRLGHLKDVGFMPLGSKRLYYVALSKSDDYHELILKRFSKTLKIFKSTESYRSILNRYGLSWGDIWSGVR